MRSRASVIFVFQRRRIRSQQFCDQLELFSLGQSENPGPQSFERRHGKEIAWFVYFTTRVSLAPPAGGILLKSKEPFRRMKTKEVENSRSKPLFRLRIR